MDRDTNKLRFRVAAQFQKGAGNRLDQAAPYNQGGFVHLFPQVGIRLLPIHPGQQRQFFQRPGYHGGPLCIAGGRVYAIDSASPQGIEGHFPVNVIRIHNHQRLLRQHLPQRPNQLGTLAGIQSLLNEYNPGCHLCRTAARQPTVTATIQPQLRRANRHQTPPNHFGGKGVGINN